MKVGVVHYTIHTIEPYIETKRTDDLSGKDLDLDLDLLGKVTA